MEPPAAGPGSDVAAASPLRFASQLERTVDRLRSLSLARLAAPFEPEPSRAEAARELAQRLADAAATAEGAPRRELPRLADSAVGDQVAVCGHDLLAALGGREPADASTVLDSLAEDLLDLRRRM